MGHVNLEGIAEDSWDKVSSSLDYIKGLYEESRGNLKPEALCISACTAGEIVGASLAYYGGRAMEAINQNQFLQDLGGFFVNYSNEWGIPVAIAAGGIYIYNHIKKDSEKHNAKPSRLEVLYWAGTTESICVATAIGIEYAGMNWFGNPLTGPLDLENLSVELLGWAFAFAPATAAMSVLTFDKKKEAGRIIADKGKLYDVADGLREDHKVSGSGNRIRVHGDQSSLTISEQELPQIYHRDFDPKKSSLYRILAPRAKYSKDARTSLEGFACEAFNIAKVPHAHVEDPFAHDHSSHEHPHPLI